MFLHFSYNSLVVEHLLRLMAPVANVIDQICVVEVNNRRCPHARGRLPSRLVPTLPRLVAAKQRDLSTYGHTCMHTPEGDCIALYSYRLYSCVELWGGVVQCEGVI